ncbi:hypothetical protein SLA2020_389090 [Shorea laevis]
MSPDKLNTVKSKRRRPDSILVNPLSPSFSGHQQVVELANDTFGTDTDEIRMDIDPFGNQRSKCAGFFPALIGGDGLSRYHTDFHEIKQIGTGNFSRVFKVLKRIDGCLYAVKHSTRQLHQDTERRKALMEVQALAGLGSHENIVGYYSSWFENEQLYIQMELCDQSLSISKSSQLFTEGEVLQVLHQLGDFGCATLIDKSLPIEEGDARYMPQEILNEKYDHLDKVDIFSLGAAIYELIRGLPLPESGSQVLNLKGGKLPLLPGHSLQLQNLLKAMVDPDPVRRPSAKELVENPIFDRVLRNEHISCNHGYFDEDWNVVYAATNSQLPSKEAWGKL